MAVSSNGYMKLFKEVTTKLHNLQAVRYYRCRKPLWMPRAKSKMFKVPPRPVIPIEDTLELRRLHNNYRTQVKSLRVYLVAQWKEKTEETIDHEAEKLKFEEDFQKSVLINQEWAGQLKPIRENFMADELKKTLDSALEEMEKDREIKEKAAAEIEEYVQQVKADSKNFITAENIDASIDQALENVVDYNHAITLSGDKILDFKKVVNNA